MRRPQVRELGYQIGVRPYFVPSHPSICEDAHEQIERIVGECPAVIGKGRRARWVVRQDIWKQCPRYPPRLSRRIPTRVLQSVCESSKETPILSRLTREVGISLFDEQDSLRRTRSALRLDPTAAIACRERARPQADLLRPQSRVRHFEDDAAHIFVSEEIVAREPKVVLRAFHIAEEWIAAPAGEEAILTCLCDPCLPPGRNRCPLDDDPPSLVGPGGLRAVNAAEGCGLCPVLEGREAHLVDEIGNCIAIGVDFELVHRCRREGLDGRGPRRARGG